MGIDRLVIFLDGCFVLLVLLPYSAIVVGDDLLIVPIDTVNFAVHFANVFFGGLAISSIDAVHLGVVTPDPSIVLLRCHSPRHQRPLKRDMPTA